MTYDKAHGARMCSWFKVISHQSLVSGQHNTRATPGFTLIEMLIATAIFMFVMLIAVGSLVSVVGADRKAQTIGLVTDNLRFVIDDFSRSVRTGYNIDGDPRGGHCLSGHIGTDCTGGTSEIQVTDQSGTNIRYLIADAATCNGGGPGPFTGGCLMRKDGAGEYMPITAPELEINAAAPNASLFYVRGSVPGLADAQQPIITMLIQATITQGVKTATRLHLQTSVTQRAYDN